MRAKRGWTSCLFDSTWKFVREPCKESSLGNFALSLGVPGTSRAAAAESRREIQSAWELSTIAILHGGCNDDGYCGRSKKMSLLYYTRALFFQSPAAFSPLFQYTMFSFALFHPPNTFSTRMWIGFVFIPRRTFGLGLLKFNSFVWFYNWKTAYFISKSENDIRDFWGILIRWQSLVTQSAN